MTYFSLWKFIWISFFDKNYEKIKIFLNSYLSTSQKYSIIDTLNILGVRWKEVEKEDRASAGHGKACNWIAHCLVGMWRVWHWQVHVHQPTVTFLGWLVVTFIVMYLKLFSIYTFIAFNSTCFVYIHIKSTSHLK